MRVFGEPSGFSMVELIVVVAIFGLLLTGISTSFRSFSQRTEFVKNMAEFQTLFTEAKSIARTGEGMGTATGVVVTLSYSAPTLSASSFADTNSNGAKDNNEPVFRTVSIANGLTATMTGAAASGSAYTNNSAIASAKILFPKNGTSFSLFSGTNELRNLSVVLSSSVSATKKLLFFDARSGLLYVKNL